MATLEGLQQIGGPTLARRRRHKRRQPIVLRQQHGALHGIAQLADVARPVVIQVAGQGVAVDAQRGFALLPAEAVDEVTHDGGNILAALAQRSQTNLHHVETIVQIVAEGPGLHSGLEIHMGGGYQADVQIHQAVAPQPLDAAALDGAQDLRLRRQRQVADLVQKQRPPLSLLELARPFHHIRGGATHHAEQLALHQRFGQRGTVHRYQRPLRPLAMLVQTARHQFLAGTTLAPHQDVAVRGTDALDEFAHLLHGGRLPHHGIPVPALTHFATQNVNFLGELSLQQCVRDGRGGEISVSHEEVRIGLAEQAVQLAVVHVERPQHTVGQQQRHADERTDAVVEDTLVAAKALIGHGVGGEHRSGVLHRRLEDVAADLPGIAQHRSVTAAGGARVQAA